MFGRQKITFLTEQLNGILHSQVKLFTDQVVADLRAAEFVTGSSETLLRTVGIQPKTLYCFEKRLFLIELIERGQNPGADLIAGVSDVFGADDPAARAAAYRALF